MSKIHKAVNKRLFFRTGLLVFGVFMLSGLGACSGNYGSLTRDAEVYQAFLSNQVSTEYKYYYNAHSFTYAILGIDSRYWIESKFWRETTPDTEQFKQLTERIWEDYGYYPYGANILDPSGNKIGIWYSSIDNVAFKFFDDNEIAVLLGTPYLWGPDDGFKGGIREPD